MPRCAEVPCCPVRLSPAFRLIAQCTIRPPVKQLAQWQDGVLALANTDTDWNEVLRLVRRHQVPVLVDDALKKNLGADVLPKDIHGQLSDVARRSRMNALLQIAQCAAIAARFAQAGIRVIQLKGAPLSRRLYGDSMLRCCGDVDLLIDWNSLSEAIALLQAMHFTLTQPRPASNSMLGLIDRHAHHDCALVHTDTQLHLELHWRPVAWGSRMSAELLRLSRPDVQFGPAAPPENLEMLDLLAHGTSHYWVRLKWLSDIQQAALIRPASFWNDVVRLAADMRGASAVRIAAILACWIFRNRADALTCIAAGAPSRDFEAAQYALGRMLADRVDPRGAGSAAAKTYYRLATCTPYQLMSTALRCVQFFGQRERRILRAVASNAGPRRS